MKFDPFSQWGKVLETWQKMADDSIARTNAFYAEVEKAEAKRVEQVETVIGEMAKVQRDTLAYTTQIGSEMRKLTLETMARAKSFTSEQTTSA